MSGIKKPARILLAVVTALGVLNFAACTRTVHWNEEVLLNTGETIWISKEVRYSIKGQPGNPADLGYLPDSLETTSFKYGGRSYTYTGDAGIMVLAISPKAVPVLLAHPGDGGWHEQNDYPICAKPYYVQLVPDSTGQHWAWPSQIEPWTYDLPANLMRQRDHPSRVEPRYTMADKAQQRYMKDPQLLDSQKINPLNINRNCRKE